MVIFILWILKELKKGEPLTPGRGFPGSLFVNIWQQGDVFL